MKCLLPIGACTGIVGLSSTSFVVLLVSVALLSVVALAVKFTQQAAAGHGAPDSAANRADSKSCRRERATFARASARAAEGRK